MGKYWPANAAPRPLDERAESGQLEHLAQGFHHRSGRPDRAAKDCIKGSMGWKATSHRAKYPGAPVLAGGDFNPTIHER